jgi:uncharacterized membrane protein YdfJ with MMPL/SSD domain
MNSTPDFNADRLVRLWLWIITSAAAIMIVMFAGFTLGDFLVIKMPGFTLAAAVLIDATLVPIAIGPTLLSLAGDWDWRPWGLPAQRQLSRRRASDDYESSCPRHFRARSITRSDRDS